MADAVRGSIVINEVLPDPNSAIGGTGPRFDTDLSGNVTALDEFIEIYNSGPSAVDISGLQLWDRTVGNWFTFPAGTILQPGAHAMVMVGTNLGTGPALGPDDLAFYAGRSTAVLNNSTPENAILYDPAANTYVQVALNGAAMATPGVGGAFTGLPAGATQIGSGENFGTSTPGYSLQRDPDGGDTIISGPPNPANDNICFAEGTRIATPHGPRAVETLRPGDMVLTTDETAMPVLWLGSSRFSAARLWREPRLWPVTVAAGSLGPGLPARDLRLSRQHRLRLGGAIAQRMGGSVHVLVPVHALLGLPGITLSRPAGDITYYHLLLPRHAIVLAEDLPAESFFPGPQALEALDADARAELARLLGDTPPDPAHPVLTARKARALVLRHLRQGQPLRP